MNSLTLHIRSLNKFLDKYLFHFTAFTSIAFFVLVMVAIISRFWLPVLWTLESGRVLFVWSVYGAALVAYHRNLHIALSIVTDMFSPQWQKLVHGFIHGLCAAFFALVGGFSIYLMITLQYIYLPVLEVSKGIFYAPLPLLMLAGISFALENAFSPQPAAA